MMHALRAQEVQDAIYESVVVGDWTDGLALREKAERRLGCKIKLHEFSRAIVALISDNRIKQQHRRRSDTEAPRMQYRRSELSKW